MHAGCPEDRCCKQKVGLHVHCMHMHGQLCMAYIFQCAHLDRLLCAMLGSQTPS